jgi:glutaminyl-peptide cyclotransferase
MPMTSKRKFVLAGVAAAGMAAFAIWSQIDTAAGRGAPTVEVIAAHPHDPIAFTQGLVVHDGRLLEGTGQYGRSSLRRVDIATGRIEQLVPLGSAYFGEGIAVLDGRIYQLTWQNGVAFVYDAATFAPERTVRYDGEGWGLTTDGESLILSDGSASLSFLEPQTFNVERQITVRENGQPIVRLNELEYIDGEIWANVWYDDRIVRIAPSSGEVLGWIDLSRLYPSPGRARDDVLNGIAYDADSGRLFVTGKNWPQLFEIEVGGL